MAKYQNKFREIQAKLNRIKRWVDRLLVVEYYSGAEEGDKLGDIKDLLAIELRGVKDGDSVKEKKT